MKKDTKTPEQIQEPKWTIWNTKGPKKLEILNPSDFDLPKIIGKIRKHVDDEFIDSLGISDEKEIIQRNELMKFLLKNKELRNDLITLIDLEGDTKNLPKEENDFLLFYEKDNVYWEAVKNFIKTMKSYDKHPKKIIPFLQKTEESIKTLPELEKTMAQNISESLKGVSRLEGFFSVSITDHFWLGDEKANPVIEVLDKGRIIIGQKRFNSIWSNKNKVEIPKWAQNWFCKITGIQDKIKESIRKEMSLQAKKSSIVTEFPNSIERDIELFLKKEIETIFLNFYKKEGEIGRREYQKLFSCKSVIKFYFQYDANGMRIMPTSIKLYDTLKQNVWYIGEFERKYNSYTAQEEDVIKSRIEDIDTEIYESQSENNGIAMSNFFKKFMEMRVGSFKEIVSPATDSEFRWLFLPNLYRSAKNIDTYNLLIENRKDFWGRINELYKLSRILGEFEEVAERRKIPLSMPEIKAEKSGIKFKLMAPINMMNQEKTMVPFSFPKINGKIICLTGKHGGGKSVSGKSIMENLWLAQSGLPVFAEGFETEVKEIIGTITNESGEGSTFTVFLKKTLTLFENIEKTPSHKSLLFIDEFGKGTQKESEMELGLDILRALSKNENSILFNTQSLELVEYAKNNFNAICLKVDDTHQFQPGIGDGQMRQLVKEIGLDKYLK